MAIYKWKAPAWTPPASAQPYMPDIHAAAKTYNLPPGMLTRQLYQESHFRADIVSGRTKSRAGAVGIAQLIPADFPGVDPTNPRQSIWAAARYDRQLYNRFGDWKSALAAYNWGPGNLSRHGMGNAPAETVAYVAQISADVPAIQGAA